MNIIVSDIEGALASSAYKIVVVPLNSYGWLTGSQAHIAGIVNRLAGPGLRQELRESWLLNGNLKYGEVLHTGSYDLSKFGVRRLIFTATRAPGKDGEHVHTALGHVFECMSATQYSALLPLLGCGAGGLSPEIFGTVLKKAISEHPDVEDWLTMIAKDEEQAKSLKAGFELHCV